MVFKFSVLYIACVLKNKRLPLGWRSISAVCILNIEIAILQSVLGLNFSLLSIMQIGPSVCVLCR